MRIFLLIFSLLWMAGGVALILYTGQVRVFFHRAFADTNMRLMAPLPVAIGLMFLACSYSRGEIFPLFLILGSLAVAKGLYLLAGPMPQIKNLLEWWTVRAGEVTLRAWGIVTLVLGIAVFSHALRG